MKRVFLHGSLKEDFGEYFDFDAATPMEALRAMLAFIPGFKEAIKEGEFKIIRGGKQKGFALGIDELKCKFGHSRHLHVVPVLKGAGSGKGGGVIKTVLGVALVAVAVAGAFFSGGMTLGVGVGALGASFTLGTASTAASIFGSVAMLGIGVTLAGASAMLATRPDVGTNGYAANESADERPSYLFNTTVNRSSQGAPVPLVYGRVRTGSVVVSVGLDTEAI